MMIGMMVKTCCACTISPRHRVGTAAVPLVGEPGLPAGVEHADEQQHEEGRAAEHETMSKRASARNCSPRRVAASARGEAGRGGGDALRPVRPARRCREPASRRGACAVAAGRSLPTFGVTLAARSSKRKRQTVRPNTSAATDIHSARLASSRPPSSGSRCCDRPPSSAPVTDSADRPNGSDRPPARRAPTGSRSNPREVKWQHQQADRADVGPHHRARGGGEREERGAGDQQRGQADPRRGEQVVPGDEGPTFSASSQGHHASRWRCPAAPRRSPAACRQRTGEAKWLPR